MEESFTVHLGSQMKRTHNLRLMTGSVVDMCRSNLSDASEQSQAQRLMTSLSLYSQKLSAVVLLVSQTIGSQDGSQGDFYRICESVWA
jgi:hypothetical protein